MKPMIWRPEPGDVKVNQYLDHLNHAPYFTIFILLLVMFSVFTFLVLLGSF